MPRSCRSPRSIARLAASLSLLAVLPLAAGAQGAGSRPLQVYLDAPSKDSVSHVIMPPGWHVTSGPAALLSLPEFLIDGRFALSLEVFVFPETQQGEIGLFVGGGLLDMPERQSYIAFVVRRPGEAAVVRMEKGARTMLSEWVPAPSFKDPKERNQLNQLRVSVERDSLRFEVNGARVVAFPNTDWGAVAGFYGIRTGTGVNLHVSNLDVTKRLAPAPAPKR